MKTSSISYRVADFLRRYPPFQFFEEDDLLELTSGGRVQFHEADEIVFRQGEPRGKRIWVVQQGKVELLDLTPRGERLKDVLGEGDILGVGGFLGQEIFLHTARTASDVLLYAFAIEDFNRLIRRHPRATLFVTSYFSMREDPALAGPAQGSSAEPETPAHSEVWIRQSAELDRLARRRLIALPPGATVREAAARMRETEARAAALTDGEGRAVGLLTTVDLVGALADGVDGESLAHNLRHGALLVVDDALTVGEFVLEMMRSGVDAIGLNNGGDGRRPLEGLAAASDIALLFGRNPALAAREIRRAEDVERLAELCDDAQALIRDGLLDRSLVSWFSEVATELNRAILGKTIELAETELRERGLERPAVDVSWLFFGSAGRRELLTRADLDFGLVHSDAEPGRRRACLRYFGELTRGVVRRLERCGYTFSARSARPTEAQWRRSLTGWRAHYESWVERPVESNIYYGRPFFDILGASANREVLQSLETATAELVKKTPDFVPALAGDSLARVPPLAFYQGLVVAGTGEQADRLDLRTSALYPLTDAARALALLDGFQAGQSTIDRLHAAADRFPDRRVLFEEAAEAHLVALYHRARSGLRHSTDGGVVRVSALSKFDQQLLKSAFRAILELLELTAETFGLERV